jgi:16S rRNA (uracil1498-N3)-methyltransferase
VVDGTAPDDPATDDPATDDPAIDDPAADGPAPRSPAGVRSAGHVFVDALDDLLRPERADEHHLLRVLRVRDNEVITAADGAGAWRTYRAHPVAGALELRATGPLRLVARPPVALALAFGLTKGVKPEVVVARLTELGVDRIAPVAAERSVVRWDDARAATGVERLRRVAREAAVQSRRAALPVVDDVVRVRDLAGHPAALVAVPGAPPLLGVVAELGWPGADPPAEVLAIVGPEGGLAPDEVAALRATAAVGLGPAVLRAETAAVVVAGLLTALRALWYEE